ncbi:prolipoprotein diacylglyceryl transferase [Wolbachia endosymbiont of Atemnus politus]|uniref:prolipoprotein diacylglyceryl transferase n=1 Tax=Wolbachia endosymbiont of Atemnus politus TaxID=2682840 RepID=UPI001573E51D|nr:prolipoprotein diacylglyceryl transferase [Wolbachia endosymbiont of Atemnus politus]NSM56375.1 prolipoprotein diacylglyceryl transferase [Wolbachia endosymbiont of Atemnus politus]NSX83381.1 prolipoprotein diacylglyceryl transferase [Wolbachia endosymbiont of Atemnus politus]
MSLNPVIFSIGPVSIYWYSLAYVLGIMFAYWYLHKLDDQKVFTRSFYDSLLTTAIIGIILGGRLSYILIYDPVFYVSNPTQILKTWEGGMSFHGGIIGVVLAVIISCKKHNIPIFYTLDLVFCGAPIGLFLGRIGNFINGELFGRVTTMPWGVVFPESGDDFLRHPSQLYEAFSEGLLLFTAVNLLFFLTRIKLYRGALTGIAVMWYGIVRFIVEFFREPDHQVGYLWLDLTMGQWLSVPMVLLGIIVFLSALNLKFGASMEKV